MSEGPDLRGWLPTTAFARAQGVSPPTVRRRARAGLYEQLPNPLGPGALYRARAGGGSALAAEGEQQRQSAANGDGGALRRLTRDDALTLALLPGTAPGLAAAQGRARGSCWRSLVRLERAGVAKRGAAVLSGGRPAVSWWPVTPLPEWFEG